MKKQLRIISFFFFITGIAVIAYPFYTDYKVEKAQAKMEEDWDALARTPIFQQKYESTAHNEQASAPSDTGPGTAVNAKKQNSTESVMERKQIKQHNVVGKISIPKIGLNAMIVPGINQKSLKNAVGWMPSTTLPDEQGNMVLAGHRSHTYGKFFNRLGELTKEDVITIRSLSGTYTYKVYQIEVVKPTDVSVIQPTGGKTLTLVTCHPLNSNKYRLIIKAVQEDHQSSR
ncbi:class D sortase [Peribacillus saganii]|uniref:Class D sortase n=1 Tax=Peribacillus saganii TaxID=2303992 RepID=A0A372LLV2_9BACI|nr:class D sortase [Peribacillus saganii]RFU67344.1 class D sortase [Peribacillus saganii]